MEAEVQQSPTANELHLAMPNHSITGKRPAVDPLFRGEPAKKPTYAQYSTMDVEQTAIF